MLPVEIAEKVMEIVARYDPDLVGGRLLQWIRLEKPNKREWHVNTSKKSRRKWKEVNPVLASIAEGVEKQARLVRQREADDLIERYKYDWDPFTVVGNYRHDQLARLLNEMFNIKHNDFGESEIFPPTPNKEDHYARRQNKNLFKNK